MQAKPYSQYKPSGVEWLGDVPEHWAVNRLKWSVSNLANGVWGDEPDGANEIVCVRVADFDRDKRLVETASLTMRSIEPKQLQGRKLERGDLLLEKSGGGEKQLVGCVVVFNHDFDAVTSNFVARMQLAPQMDSSYWCYVHAALYAGRLNYPAIKQNTGIQNLDSSEYLNNLVVFPPLLEQRAIADFLESKTAVLDELTTKKRSLLERLREHRTALISQAVTKGVPDAEALAAGIEVGSRRFKASGVEWLGDVPEHWEVKPLKWAIMFQRGHDLPADAREEGNVPLVTSSGISATHSVAVAKAPGIVTGRYGTIGQFYLVEKNYFPLNTTLYSITLYDNSVHFLKFLLEHLSPLFALHSVKSAVPGIDRNDVHAILVSLPPLLEQRVIADYLDRETRRIDHLIARVGVALERLAEYRSALITAAVTGKIDVRDAVAAVPLEPEVVA